MKDLAHQVVNQVEAVHHQPMKVVEPAVPKQDQEVVVILPVQEVVVILPVQEVVLVSKVEFPSSPTGDQMRVDHQMENGKMRLDTSNPSRISMKIMMQLVENRYDHRDRTINGTRIVHIVMQVNRSRGLQNRIQLVTHKGHCTANRRIGHTGTRVNRVEQLLMPVEQVAEKLLMPVEQVVEQILLQCLVESQMNLDQVGTLVPIHLVDRLVVLPFVLKAVTLPPLERVAKEEEGKVDDGLDLEAQESHESLEDDGNGSLLRMITVTILMKTVTMDRDIG